MTEFLEATGNFLKIVGGSLVIAILLPPLAILMCRWCDFCFDKLRGPR